MSTLFSGIDVGGTSLKALVVNEHGSVIDHFASATQARTLVQVSSLAADLVSRYPNLAGIGIVVPGTVDEQNGTVGYASNLDLAGINIPETVTTACGRPSKLGHDGRGAGLAENLFGSARGSRSSVVIPIGTGISASLHFPGLVWPGFTNQSGEIGHIPIYVDGEPCACGQYGCLEVYASAKGIASRYSAVTGISLTAAGVQELRGLDRVADAVWDKAIEALSLVLAQITLTLDPECIVIGGGLSGAGEALLEPLRNAVAGRLKWREPPRIVGSALGDSAGLWGAAVLGCQAAGSDAFASWKPSGTGSAHADLGEGSSDDC